MRTNIGTYDRILRIIFGIILLGFGYSVLLIGYIDFVFYFFGFILIITGLLGWCPLYSLLGFSSKGEGLDKISRRDIEKAVKSYTSEVKGDIENISPKSESSNSTKKVSKKSAKKSTKKTTKKSSSTKKVSKKTTKKSSTKKTAKKSTKK